MFRKILVILLVTATFSISSALTFEDEKKPLLPSEASKSISLELREMRKNGELKDGNAYRAASKALALEYLERVEKTDISIEEQLVYADLLSQAGKDGEAENLYAEIASGTGTSARNAFKKMMNFESEIIRIGKDESKKDPAKLEKMIRDFRSKFGHSPNDLFGIYGQVSTLATYYQDHGKPEEAIRVVMEEINSLTVDHPYYSFNLLGKYQPYLDLGRKQEIQNLLNSNIARFENIAETREKDKPTDAEAAKVYERITRSYKGIASGLKSANTKMNLINAPAPGFNFTHFFNTVSIDFAKTRGKVVLIDFWANWCGPCIGTFPEMREFYAEYAPKGVVVIGVTGFQGSMANHGKERVQNISEEEELKLTAEFIKHQNVTWPIAFSDRNCYDPEYGVRGIPTAVIIDKKGNVRMFTHPYFQEKLRAMVDKLLSE